MEFEITRLGERGQIVIPLIVRESLNLKKGEKFIVVEQDDNIVLKRIKAPTKDEFEDLIRKTHEHAEKNGLTEEDLLDALKRVRSKKNKR
jgi:AbrB family looped-hinge helix DNA binding protein